jgi:ankyrin repeat protein
VGGHTAVAEVLIKSGANLNATVDSTNTEGLAGSTPLHVAVEKGQTAVVELLIKNGANINATVDRGVFLKVCQNGEKNYFNV